MIMQVGNSETVKTCVLDKPIFDLFGGDKYLGTAWILIFK